MYDLIRIDDPGDARITAYLDIRERDLVGRQGRFVAEGKVVLRALVDSARFKTESVLVSENRISGIKSILEQLPAKTPVYSAAQQIIDKIAGFPLHRGILAIGRRGEPTAPQSLLPAAGQTCVIAVCCGISNHDNVGSIFRNAAAFGVDAILLDDTCCDPLYRKALRVSVGAALKVPFAKCGSIGNILDQLAARDIEAVSLTPGGQRNLERFAPPRRLAVVFGSEGEGLPQTVLDQTVTLRISMTEGFDSLNVAAASSIAFHHIRFGKC